MLPAIHRLLVPLLAQENAAPLLPSWLPFLLIGIAFIFIMWLPERRARAEQNRMREGLKKNDRVVTIGGIIGTVLNAPKGSEEVVLRIDDSSNAKMRVLRSAIARVLTEDKEKKAETTPESSP